MSAGAPTDSRLLGITPDDFKLIRDGLAALEHHLYMDTTLLHVSEQTDAAKERLARRAARAHELVQLMSEALMTSKVPTLDFTKARA